MFAQLGNIVFSLGNIIEGMDGTRASEFAEHRVIEGKPRLQWVGDGLETLTLDINLHRAFCIPETEIKRLEDARAAHEAMALVFGNGEYIGMYVITELSRRLCQADGQGNLISANARMSLKEWVEASPLEFRKQQMKAAAKGLKKKGAKPKPTAKTGSPAKKLPNKDDVTKKQIVRQG